MRAAVLSIREPRLTWRARDYALWRAVFGAYLTVHFAQLIAWAPEIWSSSGVLANGADSPLLMPFNLFAIADSPSFVTAVVTLATGLSFMLAVGWYDRLAAVALWYVLASMLGRNPLIANPGLPFVGWLLLAHALAPHVPRLDVALARRSPGNDEWRFPPFLWTAAWIVMAVGYTYSGYTKLVSPSWVDGTAFRHLLENPLARDAVWRGFALSLPGPVFAAATWGALALELAFAPLALLQKARPWLWLAMVGMHAGLVMLVDFADLTLGMLMIHLFTFNPAWIRWSPAR